MSGSDGPVSKTQRRKDELSQSRNQTGNHIGFVAEESGAGGDQIEVRVGLSYINAEQAQKES